MGTTAAGTILVNLRASVSQFVKDMDQASASMRKAGQKMESIGTTMSKAITAPVVGIGAAALKMAVDFDKSMANIATLIPNSEEKVKSFRQSIQDLSIQTGQSTSVMAEGMYQVLSAFGETGQELDLLRINAEAAVAGVSSVTDAVNLTSAVTKGYGDVTAESVQHVSDLAFQTVKLGQTTFPELADSMGRVVPIAASLKVSQEELFGVMATATGVTGTATEVSTQLRGVLQALMAPTEDMAALFADLGVSSGEAMVEQLGLQASIEAIIESAKQSAAPLQRYIGSVEGQTLALALAGPQADVFSEKLRAMAEATGWKSMI